MHVILFFLSLFCDWYALQILTSAYEMPGGPGKFMYTWYIQVYNVLSQMNFLEPQPSPEAKHFNLNWMNGISANVSMSAST